LHGELKAAEGAVWEAIHHQLNQDLLASWADATQKWLPIITNLQAVMARGFHH
jgi:hypothetical protein